jgi:hypothetical protein
MFAFGFVSKVMARYRVHFLDPSDRVIDTVELEADSDDAAIEQARRIDVPSIGAGFDLLQDSRLVYRHRR